MSQSIKVAIQGDKASFHEIAAKQYYTQPVEWVYCKSFHEVFRLLSDQQVDKGFVATTNSAHGVIKEVRELIARYPVLIEGDYSLPINQHLIGHPGATPEIIQTITSHPVALSQCSNYLSKVHQSALLVPHYDTSAAIEYVKDLNDTTVAAIGSKAAADLHGLAILVESVQNDPNNITVFCSLSYAG